ncbi:hypothetical protein ACNKHR_17685 [Shigella flexneri]
MIEIIRNEDEPKPALMSRFGLAETRRKRSSTETASSCQTGRDEIRGERSELEKSATSCRAIWLPSVK